MLRFSSRAGRWPLAFSLLGLAALTACADRLAPAGPEGPPTADGGGAERQDLGSVLGGDAHWADGYTELHTELSGSGTPGENYSFNRAGGAITLTKVAGTTGRYVVTFSGLSAYLGGRSTVRVTGYGADNIHCKPAAAYLVSDKVEVRCFKAGTGLPADGMFNVVVTRNYYDLAFAYAHQETATGYAPSTQGSWNPAGTSTVVRSGVGQYRVTFNNLAARLRPGVMGHVQVNAVGTSNAYCNAYNSFTNATPNLTVEVRCFTATGAPADRRFTVLFALPADRLAYAWADQPSVDVYSPSAYYSWNPARGPVTVIRTGVGAYTLEWTDLHTVLLLEGHAQVTAYGSSAQCKVQSKFIKGLFVRCFAPNGTPVDSRYTVLRGS